MYMWYVLYFIFFKKLNFYVNLDILAYELRLKLNTFEIKSVNIITSLRVLE